MVRDGYPRLFAGRPEEAAAADLAARTFEFSEFLVDVLGVEELPGRACAARGRGDHSTTPATRGACSASSSSPSACWAMIEGLEYRPLEHPELCCGFGGTFAVKMARHLDGHGRREGRRRAGHRRRPARRPRHELPDEHRGPAAAPRQRGSRCAIWPRCWPRGGRRERRRRAWAAGPPRSPAGRERASARATTARGGGVAARLRRARRSARSPTPPCSACCARARTTCRPWPRRPAPSRTGRTPSTRSPACGPRRSPTSTATSSSSPSNVERVGGHVFFAADAAEAREHVVGLARERGARLIVKSKSMVTEEIGLNPALEAAGVRGRRDRSRRVHRAARRRAALPHPQAGHPPAARADPRAVLGRRRARRGRRARGHDALRPRRVAREVPGRRHGHLGRQLRRGRDGLDRARHQRGQRPHDDHPAAHPRGRDGRRAPGADPARPRGDPRGAAARRRRPAHDRLRDRDHRTAPRRRGRRPARSSTS